MAYGNLVTLVNRSTQWLEGTFDGQIIKMAPGYVDDGAGNIVRAVDGHGAPVVTLLPSHVAALVKSQNPIMGTQDPNSPAPEEYLVGVQEWSTGRQDDISPAEQSDSIEIINRSAIADEIRSTKAEVVKAKGGKSRSNVAVKPRINTGGKSDYED